MTEAIRRQSDDMTTQAIRNMQQAYHAAVVQKLWPRVLQRISALGDKPYPKTAEPEGQKARYSLPAHSRAKRQKA